MLKAIINRYNQYGISKKLLVILLIGSVVPVLLTASATCMIAVGTIKKQTDILMDSNMKLSKKGLDDYFAQYDRIIMSIYTENQYADKLKKLNVWDSRNYYLLKRQLENDLGHIAYLHPGIVGIGIVTQKRECILYDSVTNSSMDSYCFPEKDPSWLDVVDQTFQHTGTIYSGLIERNRDGETHNIFYIGHRIADMDNYRQGTVGSLLICLDEAGIRETYSQKDEVGLSFLCNAKGEILSSTQENLLGQRIFDGQGTAGAPVAQGTAGTPATSDTRQQPWFLSPDYEAQIRRFLGQPGIMETKFYSVYTSTIHDGELFQVRIRDNQRLLGDFKYIIGLIILFTIFIIITSLRIMVSFAGALNQRVSLITTAMDKAYKGDYTVQIVGLGQNGLRQNGLGQDGSGQGGLGQDGLGQNSLGQGGLGQGGLGQDGLKQDELGLIASHFNHMVIKIDQSAKIEKEALIREKNAELRALEAQINPHFLYNTLDAINWIAIENDQFLISRMLKNLANILRYSIHKSNEVVSVKSELEYLKQYIFLQQQRFSFSFLCEMEVEEHTLELKMHKLLFQPLIENAIIHGFPGHSGQDMLSISIRKEGKRHLFVRIADNGRGMPQELVDELNGYQEGSIEGSIGIRNVIMRLKYYYGEDRDFSIRSDSKGTTIQFRIIFE